MPHFFFRLNGPRATFPQDITEEERALMQRHQAYTHSFFEQGLVLAYGPVLDPGGAFGVALIEADSMEAVETFAKSDPSIAAGMNTYTITPMRIAACQASSPRRRARSQEPGAKSQEPRAKSQEPA